MDATHLPFDRLKPLLGRALEAAIDRALSLDPAAREALAGMDGRRIGIAIAAPPLTAELTVRDGRIAVGPPVASPPADLSVSATLGAVLSQLSPWRDPDAPPVGRITVSGDAELAQRLQRIARRFDPDWEEPITRVFGDVVGHQIATAVRSALAWGRETASSLSRDGADFLVEESRDVVGRDELDAFHDDVDALRDRVERIAARLANLQRARG